MKRGDLEKLQSVGIPLDLPKNFTTFADLKAINQAIGELEKYRTIGIDVAIVYRLLRGLGTVEKFHRIYTKERAKEVVKNGENKYNQYGEPITYDWLLERKKKIENGDYIIRGNRIWGYRNKKPLVSES